MQLEIIKEYIELEFTPMAWERVQLQMMSKDTEGVLDGHVNVPESMVVEINNVLEGLYGVGLPETIKNQA